MKNSSFSVLYVLLVLFLFSGCCEDCPAGSEDCGVCEACPGCPVSMMSNSELEWYYLADLESLSTGGEAVVPGDKFLRQLMDLSDRELFNVLSEGSEYIDA
ncbi:MAG: hypothetical protein KTR29_22780, partial [Rhodothermaceae bacterium]|nr:hypothetical protein [Rhodothermaceae bacterium]